MLFFVFIMWIQNFNIFLPNLEEVSRYQNKCVFSFVTKHPSTEEGYENSCQMVLGQYKNQRINICLPEHNTDNNEKIGITYNFCNMGRHTK